MSSYHRFVLLRMYWVSDSRYSISLKPGIWTVFGFVLFCHKSSHFIRYGKSHGPVFYCELCPIVLVLLFKKGHFVHELDSPLFSKKALLCLGNLNKSCCCKSRGKLSYWFTLYNFLFSFSNFFFLNYWSQTFWISGIWLIKSFKNVSFHLLE